MFASREFPDAAEPIYDFFLDDAGNVNVNSYHKYIHIDQGRGQTAYRIHTGARIVVKSNSQMDRYLNGHLYTFINDKFRARNLIIEYYEARAAEAEAAMNEANDILTRIRGPKMPLFSGGEPHD